MKLYLASRYARRDELARYAEELKRGGHEIVSTWLTQSRGDSDLVARVESERESTPVEARVFADADEHDVLRCDALVAFSEAPYSTVPLAERGMRHVEFGLARAWGKRLVVVGPRENIGHTWAEVAHVPEWGPERLLRVLATLAKAWRCDACGVARLDVRSQQGLGSRCFICDRCSEAGVVRQTEGGA